MITGQQLPDPSKYRSLYEWAQALYNRLQTDVRGNSVNDPLPVFLPHRASARDERAADDGIVLFDPLLGVPVYSHKGRWVPMSMLDPITYAELKVAQDFGHIVSVQNTLRDITKLGRNLSISAGVTETIWLTGGNETYPNAGVNGIDTVVSNSASDTGDLIIEGFTSDGTDLTRVTQTVTLTGTTPVSLATPLNRVDRAYAEAFSQTFVGNVTVTASGPATTHITIQAGAAQSYKCALSTAANEYLFINSFDVGVDKTNSASIDFTLEARPLPTGVFRPIVGRELRRATGTTDAHRRYDPYIIVPPNSDVRARGASDTNNAGASAEITGFYAEIQT